MTTLDELQATAGEAWTLAIWIAATVGPIAALEARKHGKRAG